MAALREYLDRVGFDQLYKNLATATRYTLTPSVVARQTASGVDKYFDVSLGDSPETSLLKCLLIGDPVAIDSLADEERALAGLLIDAQILEYDFDRATIKGATYQLISAFGIRLLIDRRIHFGPELHDIYIGPDSYAMLYYVDVADIDRNSRVLDLCTGSGISALYLSLFSDDVTATDIGAEPLRLSEYNIALNRRDDAVKLRNENLSDTLNSGERFDVITCNPPFVAMPPGHPGMLYATGPGIDGLDYVRQIVSSLPGLLKPGGVAYIVADLIGGRHGPYLLKEIEAFAKAQGMQVDAMIDAVLPAEIQAEAMASLISLADRSLQGQPSRDQVNAFYHDTLRVENFYLTTLKIRTSQASGGVRMLHRDLLPKFVDAPKWPNLLLRH